MKVSSQKLAINRKMYLRCEDLERFYFQYQTEALPIDNNLAERVIRKQTIQRNNSLHYGGCEGAKMVATYHSVISTVKLHGGSAWDFIRTFFKNIFNGCRDYDNMLPGRIAMATCQR